MAGVKPFFSIIVVCLNPGEKLKLTLDSIKLQTYNDYEVIVKDGMSTDGSLELYITDDERIRLVKEADSSIYDAMNQAMAYARGEFIYFLNCGDLLFDEHVLKKVKGKIDEFGEAGIFYGNIYQMITGQEVFSNPKLSRFACFRHIPCHQAIFYHAKLLTRHPFVVKYSIKADYEHFLWCYFHEKVITHYMPFCIASYEGGGYSEANRELLVLEHKQIVDTYIPKTEIFKYKLIMFLTLAQLRTWLARGKVTSGLYNKLKTILYKGSPR